MASIKRAISGWSFRQGFVVAAGLFFVASAVPLLYFFDQTNQDLKLASALQKDKALHEVQFQVSGAVAQYIAASKSRLKADTDARAALVDQALRSASSAGIADWVQTVRPQWETFRLQTEAVARRNQPDSLALVAALMSGPGASSTDPMPGPTGNRVLELQSRRRNVVLATLLALVFPTLVLIAFFTELMLVLSGAASELRTLMVAGTADPIADDYSVRGAEARELFQAIASTRSGVRSMLTEISSGVQSLASAATQLETSSTHITQESRNASARTHTVAAAAEEMSANVISVAAGMEQTSTNLANVSASTEEMNATINEIAANSEKARRITTGATQQAKRITDQINQLSDSAIEIGKVTEAINEISAQTNLLALNATIEAARAGVAGKGFAVVANEIKELAQQTAVATEDIKQRIASVQSSTSSGIAEIEKVSHVIHEVNQIVSSIAAAIEEQAGATKYIARNVAEASMGVRDVNERVAQSSLVSREIAKDIGIVDSAATELAAGSVQICAGAEQLALISTRLIETLDRFSSSSDGGQQSDKLQS